MIDLKYFATKSGWTALKIKKGKQNAKDLKKTKEINFSGLFFWVFMLVGIVLVVLGSMKEFSKWYLGFVLIILAIISLSIGVLKRHCYKIYFYDTNVMVKEGVLKRDEINFAFLGVLEVTIKQRFIDRIFNVGNVKINFVGQNGIDEKTIYDIAKPRKLKRYLESRMAREDEMAKVVI